MLEFLNKFVNFNLMFDYLMRQNFLISYFLCSHVRVVKKTDLKFVGFYHRILLTAFSYFCLFTDINYFYFI